MIDEPNVEEFLSSKQIKKQQKKILKEQEIIRMKEQTQIKVQIQLEGDKLDKIARITEKARIIEENKRIEKEKEEENNRIIKTRYEQWLIENGPRLQKEKEEREKLNEQKLKEAEYLESLRNNTYPDIKLEIIVSMTTKFKYSNSVEYEGELRMHSIDIEEDIFVIKKQEKIIVELPRVFDNYVKDSKENIDLSDPIFIKLFKDCEMISDIYKEPNLDDIEIFSDNIQSFFDSYKIISAMIIR
jgi:hypothetical protein